MFMLAALGTWPCPHSALTPIAWPLLSMARCLRCSKKFKNDAQVLRHMAQKKSTCNNYALHLVRISRTVNLHLKENHQCALSPSQDFTDLYLDVAMGDNLSNFSRPPTPQSNQQNEISHPYSETSTAPTEVFPGASKIYRKDKSFMDVFDADQHAHHRVENVFYPFASKQDWEIASWLGRSNLSMALINEFLSLKLVCF